MVIDLNHNGKDDLEEILDDIHEQLEESAAATDAIVKEYVEKNVAPLEDMLGVDINGDGVIGSAQKAQE